MNNNNNGIFLEINDKSIQGFISNEKSKEIELITQYENKINLIKNDLNYLASIELIILQKKSKRNIKTNMRFSKVNGKYLYARIPIRRLNTNLKDVRVLVGTIDTFGDDMNKLNKNKKFMNIAENMLNDAIDNIIQKSTEKLTLDTVKMELQEYNINL
jgi:hypothetical protein